MLGTLHELDEAALIQILTEPKNALIKQYQRKFEFDNIRLKFTDDAIKAIAQQAYERKVGARGLMMILEEILLESMYHSAVAEKGQGARHHQRYGRAQSAGFRSYHRGDRCGSRRLTR